MQRHKISKKGIIAFILLFLIVQGCNSGNTKYLSDKNPKLSIGEAQKIAEEEARKRGCYGSEYRTSITYNEEVTVWKNREKEEDEQLNKLIKRLHSEGKLYWEFVFSPSEEGISGGICVVYIDRTNGDVLGFLGFE